MDPVKLDPAGIVVRHPLRPHELRNRLTRVEDTIVLCHLGVPRIDLNQWSLTIDDMVERPRILSFDDLLRYPKFEMTGIHQCCGNPLKPFEPTRPYNEYSLGRRVARRCACRFSVKADDGVRRVEVRADNGSWCDAELEPPHGREWQRFSISWSPVHAGVGVLASRAEANNGLVQPTSGRRNAIHEVPVSVGGNDAG